jgi:rhamnose utilization protein RhaD (predicted bifunctional aldolase and dehydrogenase)/NAD(P)-dependent dehydrogenase (short-subunit alcohol dehydrogenase family)
VALKYLKDLWDEKTASSLDPASLLRYRSNLLGSDLRLTNFGGGNTSSKLTETDPLTGAPVQVLWVKGSGGDLGSIKNSGFATLYFDKLLSLEKIYKGVETEDEMVDRYPLCTFNNNPTPASIDTPLHGFLPAPHVDHLHPDWAIALAASANGRVKMEEFNKKFGHKLVWVPWQRPGFELAMMLKKAVAAVPGCDGVILGGHGLFTWGNTQRESYLNTITIVDQLGQFVLEHFEKKADKIFGGPKVAAHADRAVLAQQVLPFIRGRVSQKQRVIGGFVDLPEVLRYVNSAECKALAHLGTSCPDHFIRTKIRPLFVDWDPSSDVDGLKKQIETSLAKYREEYAEYYNANKVTDSPAMRDANPTVVLIPGIGMFSFGKTKTESRITGEFYVNAIHVMEGATALGEGGNVEIPQAGPAAPAKAFGVHSNYVALPASEAFKIEYWKLEEAKIRRQPPEKELSRRIVLVVGGGSGIGREVALLASQRGAHVVVADRDFNGATAVAGEVKALSGGETVAAAKIDIAKRDAIKEALAETVAKFGGVDILINTAALFPSSPDGIIKDSQWAMTLEVNVTANYLLVDESAKIFKDQGLDASVILTSSANAIVPKRGTEAYDVSKAALSHLVRELAVGLAPIKVRVNGISPATVVKGSTMFPRDRVMASLRKYEIPFEDKLTDDELRTLLAGFYAKRTLTNQMIDPHDCAQAIMFLAGPHARCTTGHLIPVDGGLVDAMLR